MGRVRLLRRQRASQAALALLVIGGRGTVLSVLPLRADSRSPVWPGTLHPVAPPAGTGVVCPEPPAGKIVAQRRLFPRAHPPVGIIDRQPARGQPDAPMPKPAPAGRGRADRAAPVDRADGGARSRHALSRLGGTRPLPGDRGGDLRRRTWRLHRDAAAIIQGAGRDRADLLFVVPLALAGHRFLEVRQDLPARTARPSGDRGTHLRPGLLILALHRVPRPPLEGHPQARADLLSSERRLIGRPRRGRVRHRWAAAAHAAGSDRHGRQPAHRARLP